MKNIITKILFAVGFLMSLLGICTIDSDGIYGIISFGITMFGLLIMSAVYFNKLLDEAREINDRRIEERKTILEKEDMVTPWVNNLYESENQYLNHGNTIKKKETRTLELSFEEILQKELKKESSQPTKAE